MNRSVNEGYAFNRQKDTLPLLALKMKNHKVLKKCKINLEKDGYLLSF